MSLVETPIFILCSLEELNGQTFPILHSVINSSSEANILRGTKFASSGADEDSTLTYQLDIQQGKSLYNCSYCGKGFSYKSHVKRHMLIHTGEKPYVCQICSKGFGQRIELQKHMRVHTGEKPFKCPICDYRSTQLCHVKSHMKVKHPDSKDLDIKYVLSKVFDL